MSGVRSLLRNRKAAVGLILLAFFVVVAGLGPLLLGADPTDFVAMPHEPPSFAHPFGTTGQGQDVLLQTIYGARSSLVIGFVVGFAVVAIGAAIGTASAYFGGWVDDVSSLLVNVFLIMPGLPLAVVIAAYLPPGPATIALVLILTGWSWNARVIRSQALSLRQKDFIAAAIVSGEGAFAVIFREMLPNMTSILVSGFIGATVYAIGAQVGLEYLGLGDPGQVTWGSNLYWASNDAALLTGSWWTFVPTGTCVALVGFALAMINYGLDEIGNPRLVAERNRSEALGRSAPRVGGSTPVVRQDA